MMIFVSNVPANVVAMAVANTSPILFDAKAKIMNDIASKGRDMRVLLNKE
jgi:hypothetical protein